MNEEEKLTAVLGILENYWSKFTNDLSNQELSNLKAQLSYLESKIKNAKNPEELSSASKVFFENLAQVEQLRFLADIDKNQMRGGSLPTIDEAIKIKIINYCVTLQEKIPDLITDDTPSGAYQKL